MKTTILGGVFAAAALGLAGCTNSPGTPSVSFTAPTPGGPATGTSYKYKAQPVTLTINNAVRTGVATATYAVEVATDPAFANKVFTQGTVSETAGATTSVTLTALPASGGNVTYYWRSTATVGGVASPVSATQSFVV